MKVTTLDIDLAKSIFLIHGVDVRGAVVLRRRKSQKNDGNDAEAICEAAGRPTMRFVPVKNGIQQDVQALHRIRFQLVKWRTALANEIRGLLAEYGIVVANGIAPLRCELPHILD
jgi:transposase